eukprot:gene733-biopygen577
MERVAKQDAFIELLTQQRLPCQSKLLLLRASGIPRTQHLLRTQDLRHLFPARNRFDAKVGETLRHILQVPSLPEKAKGLMQLPMKHGGPGLRPHVEIACYARDFVCHKGRKNETTKAVDEEKAISLHSLLREPGGNLVWIHQNPGANRVLADPMVEISDEAFRFYLNLVA